MFDGGAFCRSAVAAPTGTLTDGRMGKRGDVWIGARRSAQAATCRVGLFDIDHVNSPKSLWHCGVASDVACNRDGGTQRSCTRRRSADSIELPYAMTSRRDPTGRRQTLVASTMEKGHVVRTVRG